MKYRTHAQFVRGVIVSYLWQRTHGSSPSAGNLSCRERFLSFTRSICVLVNARSMPIKLKLSSKLKRKKAAREVEGGWDTASVSSSASKTDSEYTIYISHINLAWSTYD